ncbi:hypothetical protein X945_5998 [Burkholderia pseudomallei ABCPW 107]|nr:hypothetical protein X945_5998 [Burkholderia pseudomallei ABCPW 107]
MPGKNIVSVIVRGIGSLEVAPSTKCTALARYEYAPHTRVGSPLERNAHIHHFRHRQAVSGFWPVEGDPCDTLVNPATDSRLHQLALPRQVMRICRSLVRSSSSFWL